MNKNTLRQVAVAVAFLATLAINGLANALPLNGQTTGEISDRFDVFFVPAGYVFSIWSVIYLGLAAYAIYQALPGQSQNPRLRRAGYFFIGSCVANITWLFLWHYEIFILTLLAMVALLVFLILVYNSLEIGRTHVSAGEKWFAHVPFSIYLGWISVATIANATSLLDFLNWNGFGLSEAVWAVIMLFVGVALGALVVLTRRDIAYGLVLVWAFAGIAVKHAATPLVANAGWIATGLVAAFVLVALFRPRRNDLLPAVG